MLVNAGSEWSRVVKSVKNFLEQLENIASSNKIGQKQVLYSILNKVIRMLQLLVRYESSVPSLDYFCVLLAMLSSCCIINIINVMKQIVDHRNSFASTIFCCYI